MLLLTEVEEENSFLRLDCRLCVDTFPGNMFLLHEGFHHGSNIYKETKPLMSSLLVFNKVNRVEIQSFMFVNYCPSNLLSG